LYFEIDYYITITWEIEPDVTLRIMASA